MTAILCIDMTSSTCYACGGNAQLDEKQHTHGGPKSMWEPGSDLGSTNGCGATYTHVTSMYPHLEGQVRAMRPDLEWVDPGEAIERRNGRCNKRDAQGVTCGKPLGTCVHNFRPTRFGSG